jgi:hypothetical protein
MVTTTPRKSPVDRPIRTVPHEKPLSELMREHRQKMLDAAAKQPEPKLRPFYVKKIHCFDNY